MTDPRAQTILYKMLPLAADSGWTTTALRQAGKSAGETPQAIQRLFPDGVTSAITVWQKLLDEQTAQRVRLQGFQTADGTDTRIRDRVAQGVWTRLELIGEHREAYEMATRQRLFHPRSVMRDLWHSADTIWLLAGDTATDYNFYTKRVLLAKLIFKTTLSYLGDVSDNFNDTRAYLETQIDAIVAMGQTLGKAKPVLNKVWHLAERMGVQTTRTAN